MPWKFRGNQRPNYFIGQLLGEEDFQAEQSYHIQGDRVHARGLHSWGIVDGLELSARDDGGLVLQPGSAVDRMGRVIAVADAQLLALTPPAGQGSVYLSIGYKEAFGGAAGSADSTQNYTRIAELAVLSDTVQPPPRDGSVVPLGRVDFTPARFGAFDTAIRKIAGARLAPNSFVTQDLSNGAVTAPKLSADIRSDWVRLPFKPSTFVEPQQTRSLEFSIGVTKSIAIRAEPRERWRFPCRRPQTGSKRF
jgi:hypothetical protein